jgi:cell division initiation protein
MKISPLDIQQKRFPIRLRGFAEEEVHAFLALIREEMEELLRVNASLKEQLHRTEIQIRQFFDMEIILRDTLITSEHMLDDFKTKARREAELIMKEAELQSEEIIRNAQEKAGKIYEDIGELESIRAYSKNELRRFIECYMRKFGYAGNLSEDR